MHPFEEGLARAWPQRQWRDVTVLVAVSGGPDSVALLCAMAALRRRTESSPPIGKLLAAHLNHHLRGDDATADEQFVVALCRQLGIACEVGHASLSEEIAPSGAGLETAARRVRYDFLEEVAGRHGARYVALAHTADDQAETILHRIVRGTGLGGLRGMTRARPLGHLTLIRPLLGVRRTDVLGYLADRRQSYRIDASNADRRFTRNRIRHDLLPQLARDYNPNVAEALLRLGVMAEDVRLWMDRQIGPLLAECRSEEKDGPVRLETQRLHSEPVALVRELLVTVWQEQGWPMQQMGFEQWRLMAEMVFMSGNPASPHRKHTFPGGIVAEAGPQGLILHAS